MMYGYENCGYFGNVWFMIIPAITICILIYLVIKVLLNNDSPSTNEAINDLNRKLANGEINEEEYLRIKRIIKQK